MNFRRLSGLAILTLLCLACGNDHLNRGPYAGYYSTVYTAPVPYRSYPAAVVNQDLYDRAAMAEAVIREMATEAQADVYCVTVDGMLVTTAFADRFLRDGYRIRPASACVRQRYGDYSYVDRLTGRPAILFEIGFGGRYGSLEYQATGRYYWNSWTPRFYRLGWQDRRWHVRGRYHRRFW
ncbi:MAG: hypothetical protein V1495_00430 [Pseudomonadota bacterium]